MPITLHVDQARIISTLGFPRLEDVEGRNSIAEQFPASKKRCGIYLLAFRGGLFYIGQSVDIVKRFGQHRLVHDDIVGISFQAVRRADLDDREQRLISFAESSRLPLTNRVHVADVIGRTDFDLLMPEEDQQGWLRQPGKYVAQERTSKRNAVGEEQFVRYEQRFKRFTADSQSGRVVSALREFVPKCVPAFRRGEGSFWSLSCMPSTGGPAWGRLAVVNLRSVEILVIGKFPDPQEDDLTWGFVNVAESTMREHYGSLTDLRRCFPKSYFEVRRAHYPSAGGDVLQIYAVTLDALKDALRQRAVQKAARVMTLRQVRKGATIYSKFHCPQLAGLVV